MEQLSYNFLTSQNTQTNDGNTGKDIYLFSCKKMKPIIF